jgi:hypothetical protein
MTEPGYLTYKQPSAQPLSDFDRGIQGTLVSYQTAWSCKRHLLTSKRAANHHPGRSFQLDQVAR